MGDVSQSAVGARGRATSSARLHDTSVDDRPDPSPGGNPSSPVPCDQWLWPGEPSFTEGFGWLGHGRLDLRVFEQDLWWVDITGSPPRIAAISADYRAAAIDILTASANYRYLKIAIRRWVTHAGATLYGLPAPPPDLDPDDGAARSPVEWLQGTPLMIALGSPPPT